MAMGGHAGIHLLQFQHGIAQENPDRKGFANPDGFRHEGEVSRGFTVDTKEIPVPGCIIAAGVVGQAGGTQATEHHGKSLPVHGLVLDERTRLSAFLQAMFCASSRGRSLSHPRVHSACGRT